MRRTRSAGHDGIGGYASVAQFIEALSAALAKDHVAIVNIQGPNGVGGHSLVAYALTTTPNGYAMMSTTRTFPMPAPTSSANR